jgi:hypothetical protein
MTWLALAAGLQVLVVAANLPLRRILRFREEHARLSPIVRQIHEVHHAYLLGVLLLFAGVSFAYPAELAAPGLGRALAAAVAVFWGARVVVQRTLYGRAALRRHRTADLLFTAVFAFLAAVYGATALGGLS